MRILARGYLVGLVAVCVYVTVNAAGPTSPPPTKKGSPQLSNITEGVTSPKEERMKPISPYRSGSRTATGDFTKQMAKSTNANCDYRTDKLCHRCTFPKFAGEGVHQEDILDGYIQCTDGSDERHPRTCDSRSDSLCWGCGNPAYEGEGVSYYFVCDKHKDCTDGSDEMCAYECDPTRDQGCFKCHNDNGQPKGVYFDFTCDNIVHCADGSDEYCKDNAFGGDLDFCTGKDCKFAVNYVLLCDGYTDSRDGLDEKDCFTCADGYFKIDNSYVCDGHANCYDSSDEASCNNQGIGMVPPTQGTSCDESWSQWSACDNQCGAGRQSRTRCVLPEETKTTEYEKCQGTNCPPEKSSGCGTRVSTVAQGRIVGGVNAEAGAWPWQAQLMYGGSFKCGGTLYRDKYVISAAHCFQNEKADASKWTVRLGNLRTFGTGDVHVSSVLQIRYPQDQLFNPITYNNDIVALELASPAQQTPSATINNICLDIAGAKTFKNSSNCYITGFGLTSEGGTVASDLQAAFVPIISTSDCEREYLQSVVSSNMLCAGYPGLGGVDTCQGDSGGPLVCTAPESDGETRWYLVGVTSWGYGCAQKGNPGVYAKVSEYTDWLGGLS